MTLDVKDVRARLEAERQRLAEEIEALAKAEVGEGDGAGHPGTSNDIADEATETFEHEKTLALVENLRGLSAGVEHAIDKLEKGTYGVCDECGRPIAAERLEAIPWASLCIECKARQERR